MKLLRTAWVAFSVASEQALHLAMRKGGLKSQGNSAGGKSRRGEVQGESGGAMGTSLYLGSP